MRLRLDIAYDGTHFRGWARQPGLRTVQGVLEAALERVLRLSETPRLVVAGRTDTGVHASGQVAHLDVPDDAWSAFAGTVCRRRAGRTDAGAVGDGQCTAAAGAGTLGDGAGTLGDGAGTLAGGGDRACEVLVHRVRGVVGAYADVAITGAAEASPGFDARFSAVWRRYEYRIADRTAGYDPLERYRTTSVRAALDEHAMDAAARSLVGLHDFAAYCRPREGATTIRTLLDFDWRRDDRGVLVARVRADAFCHSMVRALVGACAAVGEGRLTVPDVVRLRDAGARTSAFPVLAARGLTLTEVGYPADELLARRAEQTRARRTPE